jgi:hypothetical protein
VEGAGKPEPEAGGWPRRSARRSRRCQANRPAWIGRSSEAPSISYMEGALSYCARLTRRRPPTTRQQIVARRGHACDCKSRSRTVHRRRAGRWRLDPRFALTRGNTVFSGSSVTGVDARSGNRPMMRASFYGPVGGRRSDLGRINGGPGREPPEPPATTPCACGVASHTTQNRKHRDPARVHHITMSSMSRDADGMTVGDGTFF